MDTRIRIIGAVLVATVAAGMAVVLVVENAKKPKSRLESMIAEFIECLPKETTEAQREEIAGIMNRFHDRATAGRVEPQDVVDIEGDLAAYIEKGGIPQSELFEFMSKVGSATRRMGSEPEEP